MVLSQEHRLDASLCMLVKKCQACALAGLVDFLLPWHLQTQHDKPLSRHELWSGFLQP